MLCIFIFLFFDQISKEFRYSVTFVMPTLEFI